MDMDFEAFRREWVKNFAGDIPSAFLQKYVLCHGMAWNFIWHAFSWELLPEDAYLEGDAARRAFEEADKDGARGIDPFGERPTLVPLSEERHTAKAVEQLTEYYIVGRDFAWTYIKTHEEDLCGPYFCRKRTDSAVYYDEAVVMNAEHERQCEQKGQEGVRRRRRLSLAAGVGLALVSGAAVAYYVIQSFRE